ncbi:MAG: hypothetical protein OEV42_09160 [Deltaproteobacteria bacterium]|nr:hypothetical protein [Deltaproteobacteria bacterium]
MPNHLYKVVLVQILLLFLGARDTFAAEHRGRISIEDFYSSDSGSANNRHLLTSRVHMNSTKLNKAESLSFHLDMTARKTISGEESSSTLKNERISALNFEYTGPSDNIYFAMGRLWPKELFLEHVDGINLIVQKKKTGIGLFGGAKPDPYTEEYNSDYRVAGAYLFYNKNKINAHFAMVQNKFKGETDREYVYGKLFWHLTDKVRFYSTIISDRNQEKKSFDLTNVIAELTLRPDFKKSLSLGYSRFQAFQLFQSMDFEITGSKQESYYMRANRQFLDRYNIYGKYELQRFSYDIPGSERQDSTISQAGFANSKLLGTTVHLDLNGVVTDRHDSRYQTYMLGLSRQLTEKTRLTLNGSYMLTEYDTTEERDIQRSYSAYSYFSLNKEWNVTVSYEAIKGEDYSSRTVVSRLTYKF